MKIIVTAILMVMTAFMIFAQVTFVEATIQTVLFTACVLCTAIRCAFS